MEPMGIESRDSFTQGVASASKFARSRAVSTNSTCSHGEEYSSSSDNEAKSVAYRSCLHRVLENHKRLHKPVEPLPEEKPAENIQVAEQTGVEHNGHVEFRNCKHCKSLFPFALSTAEEWKVHFCSGECHLSFFVK